jgi:hypothetical protein
MSTKWSTEILGKAGGTPDFSELLKDEPRVLLLKGKNTFGDFVYCYLKITAGDIKKLEAAMSGENGGGEFNIHDFGTVLAAGRGDPPSDVRAEIAAAYPTLGGSETGAAALAGKPAPLEKKSWDEY